MKTRANPIFWHDQAIPYLEARAVKDGRGISYGKHAHETFSIGLVTGGESIYLNGRARVRIRAGAVVLMNPGDVHACNPTDEQPWSYRMLYVDRFWLANIQHESGLACHVDFHPYTAISSYNRKLYRELEKLHTVCLDPLADIFAKENEAVSFFTTVNDMLLPVAPARFAPSRQLQHAAELIRALCMHSLKIDDICREIGLSSSHFIRAFKARYGMTPHAYLVNCRVEYCRSLLRQGVNIADAAFRAGFADQAHMQRTFKHHVAATPGQYRAHFR